MNATIYFPSQDAMLLIFKVSNVYDCGHGSQIFLNPIIIFSHTLLYNAEQSYLSKNQFI